MFSSDAFDTMVIVLLVFLHVIRADTGSTSSDGGQRGDASILQLINQESLLRLTLDKQLQDLRLAVYDLKSEVARIDKSFQNEKLNNSFQTLKEETSDTFLKVEKEMLELSTNISSFQDQIREEKARPVYFSAFLNYHLTTQTSNEIIKFGRVIVKEGGGYSASTGRFTCPESGAYLLSFGFLSNTAKATFVKMYINGNAVMGTHTPGDIKLNSAERIFVHPLTKGDQVDVRVLTKGAMLDEHGYTSFSAVYIH